jgi:hypothetical protein
MRSANYIEPGSAGPGQLSAADLQHHRRRRPFFRGFFAINPILVSGRSRIGLVFRAVALHQHPEMVFGSSCSIYPRSLNG